MVTRVKMIIIPYSCFNEMILKNRLEPKREACDREDDSILVHREEEEERTE